MQDTRTPANDNKPNVPRPKPDNVMSETWRDYAQSVMDDVLMTYDHDLGALWSASPVR